MVKPREVIYEQANVKNMLHYVNVWFLPFKWGGRGMEILNDKLQKKIQTIS
jgi:hypothetical protein